MDVYEALYTTRMMRRMKPDAFGADVPQPLWPGSDNDRRTPTCTRWRAA